MRPAILIGTVTCATALLASLAGPAAHAQAPVTPGEAREIAKEAYLYGNPMVDGYRVLYASFVDRKNPDYRGSWNEIHNIAHVYTYRDRTVQTPNSDTSYSWLGLDLRAEPYVLTVPAIDKKRYFSIQLVDLYTHNFGYIGSRTTGNEGGHFLIAGPNWRGRAPEGITKTIRSETELVVAIYRTQLFNPRDLEGVKAVQARYQVQPLSAFLGRPAPRAAPSIDYLPPMTHEAIRTSPRIFQQLNFVLQFCPTVPSEQALMERFARIDVGAGKTFEMSKFSPEIRAAIGQGIEDAWADFAKLKKQAEIGEIGSADLFGTREHLKDNHLYRMGGAVMGIWGSSAEEAISSSYKVDADGQKLYGSQRYYLRFARGALPPVNAFWSVTMYALPQSLLVPNSINRYLLNSTMLPNFVRDADGGITLHLQRDPPDQARLANWLPAPRGQFMVVVRLYWPKPEALDGTWKLPPMKWMQ